ncbi:hypothetical protein B9Z55_010381 [Caenorhabditis nigoni]|uniref:Uncharacterized protein n=1 Tax=Caenorhabditis nigoni TaxID=1611254 RepID=A0A2G5UFK9_9PELO|nr:hypothetical protein B9Z55_010381 [Caenorhabditis nigoni]
MEDSIPECDMHSSLYGARSSRSNSIDLMSRSVYAVVDRIVQPQLLHFGDTSDEERINYQPRSFSVEVPGMPLTDEHTNVYLDSAPNSHRGSRHNLMSQSMYGTLCGTLAEEPSSADGEMIGMISVSKKIVRWFNASSCFTQEYEREWLWK